MTEGTTQFEPGNQVWKLRKSHGRKPRFESPEGLELECEDYFQWVNDNPMLAVELVKFRDSVTQVQVPKMRVMSITGLCLFLGISYESWRQHRSKPDFIAVITRVESIIYTYKFEGATAGLLNAKTISREISLTSNRKVNEYAA